jgi:hypothetical protein
VKKTLNARRKCLINCEILENVAATFDVAYKKVRLPTIGSVQSCGMDIMSLVIRVHAKIPLLNLPYHRLTMESNAPSVIVRGSDAPIKVGKVL